MRLCVVCFDRECGLDLEAEFTASGLPLCPFLCLAREGPRNGSVEARWFSRPSTVNHTTTAVHLCEDTAHQACQTCYRVGTLTYPLSFEVGCKVNVWRGKRHVVVITMSVWLQPFLNTCLAYVPYCKHSSQRIDID